MMSLAKACRSVVRAGWPAGGHVPLRGAPLPPVDGLGQPRRAMLREDWETLFRAVSARLQLLVEAADVVDAARPASGGLDPLRACVAELQQLQREFDAGLAER